jgi:hypothetical protein
MLITSACKEFSSINMDLVHDLRKSFHIKVAHGIELSAKEAAIRSAREISKFDQNTLSTLYDRFYGVQFYLQNNTKEKLDPSRMDFESFVKLMGTLSNWPKIPDSDIHDIKNPGRAFIRKLYDYLNVENRAFIKFDDIVVGLGKIYVADMLYRIEWLFQLYDDDNDGYLFNNEIILISEALLFMLKSESDEASDQDLKSISTFLNNCFEYCDKVTTVTESTVNPVDNEHHKERRLSLSAFRAVLLSDNYLETY